MTNQILNTKSKVNKKNHHRFLVNSDDIEKNNFESKDQNLINQIKNVFRLGIGSRISVFEGSGNEYLVEITKLDKGLVRGKILSKKKTIKNDFRVGLFCSLLKGDHLEMILEKCTELGVSFFQPVVFERSIIRELKVTKLERYRKIVKEAAEQSGRSDLLVVLEPIKFEKAIGKTKDGFNLAAMIGADKNILDLGLKNKDVNIFIGPEGDFTDAETELMKKEGFLFFNLGNSILRSETAAIVSCGIIAQIVL